MNQATRATKPAFRVIAPAYIGLTHNAAGESIADDINYLFEIGMINCSSAHIREALDRIAMVNYNTTAEALGLGIISL